MNLKGEHRFDKTKVLDMGANPISSKFAAVIEGLLGGVLIWVTDQNNSDLSRSHFCQFVPKTPMKVGEPWATIGQTANIAGQQGKTDERFWAGNSRLDATSIWGDSVIKGDRKIGNPTAEKGMHTRSQHFILGVDVNKSSNCHGGHEL